MRKGTFRKKIYPWRNFIAAVFTIALVGSCIVLLSRSRSPISRAAILSSEIFRRYNSVSPDKEYASFISEKHFREAFDQTYSSLYGEFPRFNLNQKISLGDGDIIGIHTGGRPRSPEGFPEKGSDARRWIDARVSLTENPRINIYGAGGVGIQTGIESATDSNAPHTSESLSVGGGFGFSYRINSNAELFFDYRHLSPIMSDSSYPQADSAGISLKLSF